MTVLKITSTSSKKCLPPDEPHPLQRVGFRGRHKLPGRHTNPVVLSVVAAVGAAGSTAAKDTVVADSASLNAAWSRAKAGDRILMAPGVYTGSVVLSGGGGTIERPIVVAAKDPQPARVRLGRRTASTPSRLQTSCSTGSG